MKHAKATVVAAFVTLLAAGFLAGLTTASASNVVRVDGNTFSNGTGWWFGRDPGNQTPYEFNFDAHKIGVGSLYVEPIGGANPSDKFVGELFTLAAIDADTSFSFDFLLGDANAHVGDFYLNAYTNLPGQDPANFYDCRFDYVATTGSTTEWTTVSTNDPPANVRARTGVSCPATLTEMPAGSTVRVFAINVGQSNASDAGTSGYLDNVVTTIGGSTTVYDFEVPPAVKDDCKNGGHVAYGFSNQGECISSVQANAHAGK